MHFGYAFEIFADKAKKDLSVNPTGIFIDMAHDAKVIGNDITVWRNFHIALMHIGMEITITQRVVEKQL